MEPPRDREIIIKEQYSVVYPSQQRAAEDAVSRTVVMSVDDDTIASDVFDALAAAIDPSQSNRLTSQIHSEIAEYVTEVANAWIAAGRKPGRAWHSADREYRGPFHEFAELVLTAVIEPHTRRHGRGEDEIPGDAKKGSMRRIDIEWLVSDDHLKKALGRSRLATHPVG
jgi:hypothetical protein